MNYIRNFKGWVASVIALILFVTIKLTTCNDKEAQYSEVVGEKFSTIYSITYNSPVDLSDSINLILDSMNSTFSPFQENTILSSINRNDTTVLCNEWLRDVITLSKQVFEATNGTFDPTISPLINSWGFGFEEQKYLSDKDIEELKKLVGMDKITLTADGKVIKENSETTLNFSAVAKGYIVDVVADFIESKGVDDYLVNIGGEIACKGENPYGESWSIGIDKPEESNLGGDLYSILALSDKSLATSGNYRNFKVYDERKVWHIIDPRTGFPTQARVLSATVIADKCAKADAYATALMVLGAEEGMPIVEADSTIEAMLICKGDTSEYTLYYSSGFKKYIKR